MRTLSHTELHHVSGGTAATTTPATGGHQHACLLLSVGSAVIGAKKVVLHAILKAPLALLGSLAHGSCKPTSEVSLG